MEILIVPIPLFNKEMAVEAHCFRFQYGNNLTTEAKPASFLDGAMNSPLLETLRLVGTEAFAMDKPIIVPINTMILLGDVARQCPKPFEKIILIIGPDVLQTEQNIGRMRDLRQHGFRFAASGITRLNDSALILSECEYLFLDQKSHAAMLDPSKLPHRVSHLKLIASNIGTFDEFNPLSKRGFTWFEGSFYRLPITRGNNHISPLKVNLIRLLNLVQNKEFEFSEVATIIERDTALSVSLLQMVNSPYLGLSQKIKSIGQAVTILGLTEMRKWTTTTVARSLGSDKPDEITKLSLIRAKFAENLSSHFELEKHSSSLFLMGLFSVIDIILDLPMKKALSMIRLDNEINDALLNQSGQFYAVFQFILLYEQSSWHSVSRQLIINDIKMESIYDAYIGATLWYKDLITEKPDAEPPNATDH